MRNLNLANFLTVLRIVLAPFAVRAILAHDFRSALVLLLIAGATDGLDGLAARRLRIVTRVGAYIDPIADKLLLSATYIAFGLSGAAPWWLVILIFARDILILLMAGAALAFTGYREFPPSNWGKISTFFQILAALAVLSAGAFPGLHLPVAPFFWAVAAATTWSGLGYLWHGIEMARRRGEPASVDK